MDEFWWDYKLMKRKMYCPKCGGTRRNYEIIGGRCDECNGAGEVVIEDDEGYIDEKI